MKTKRKQAALAADFHVDALRPECRTDNYLDTVCRKIEWLTSRYKALIVAGDFFDTAKVEPAVVNKVLASWDPECCALVVPGQHDLIGHSLNSLPRTSFQTMVEAGVFHRLTSDATYVLGGWTLAGAGWNEPWPACPAAKKKTLLVAHKATWMDPYAPGQKKGDAERLLAGAAGWDVILCGDNHQTFIARDGDRVLLSPGSLMRKRVDQISHRPCCFEIDEDELILQPVYLPIENVMTEETHKTRRERNERIEAFVERLTASGEKTESEIGLSFEDNMKQHLATTVVRPGVRKIIAECVEGM